MWIPKCHDFFCKLKDVATRVIANELNLEETPVSKVMTKNPVFVLSDTLAVDALQKMIQGFRSSIYCKWTLNCLIKLFHKPKKLFYSQGNLDIYQ